MIDYPLPTRQGVLEIEWLEGSQFDKLPEPADLSLARYKRKLEALDAEDIQRAEDRLWRLQQGQRQRRRSRLP